MHLAQRSGVLCGGLASRSLGSTYSTLSVSLNFMDISHSPHLAGLF